MSTSLWLAPAMSAAILLPYFLAKWLANIPILVFVAVVSCFLIAWFGAGLLRAFGAPRVALGLQRKWREF